MSSKYHFPFVVALIGAVMAMVVPTVQAEPSLQIYIEGATYDPVTESWVKLASSDATEPIRLWAIGNPDGRGPIYDVKIAVAYDANWDDVLGVVDPYSSNPPTGQILPIVFTPSTTGGLGGFTDPSTPSAPTFVQYSDAGDVPKLGDGRDLPSHGEYGPGIAWQEFLLGDFTATDSPMADFIDSFPSSAGPKMGQINVYEIQLGIPTPAQAHDVILHFDLYNHIYMKNGKGAKSVFAPFSHDGDGTAVLVPGPATPVALAGMGIVALFGRFRKRRRSRS